MSGNEEFLAFLRRNTERYEEIKHLSNRVSRTATRYAEAIYEVVMDDETRALSDHDLVVLCDDGNACFGGAVRSPRDRTVTVAVYTD
ncbi:hypothetical protein [Micromonospora sp. NPDC023633]|uniref:hypothetical protein n=1 Tax=Micromonospora sp. NPDC023633 TaxID=3154320 RepID=UPI0033D71FFA